MAPADYSAEWKFTVVTPVTWSDDTYHDETATLLAAVTYTGLAFDKRSSCTANGASLDPDSHDIFALYRYNGTTRNTTLNVTAFSFSNDRHVRIYMRSSYTTHVDSTLTASVLIDPTCTRLDVPYPLTLTWPVTVYAPAAWVTLSADNLTALSVFSASEIQESSQAIDTGVKIQRNSSACASTDVILGSQTSLFELYQHNAAGNRTGSGAARQDGVAMPASGGGHVGLHFKAGATITAPTTLQVVLRAEANSSCTDVRTPTAASASTVAIALRPGRAAWERRGSDQLAPAAAFSSYDLLDSDSPTPTGVQIHRSSSACSSTDVTLGADTPSYLGLDLHGDGSDAVDLQTSHSGVEMPGSGAADRHLRLYFAANANVPDGTLTVTLTLSASCAASSELPRPLQVVYQLRVRTPADHAWVALRSDSQDLRTTLFKQSEVFEDDNLATGIHLHRNSAECAATDVALLGNTDLFELVRYSAAGAADGAGAASQTAVPMTGRGDAADRHVRLRFREGAFPTGPALTASLRLSPASSCTSRRNPDPVTFAYTLAVDEDVDPPPTISVTPSTPVTIAADAATTGIRITGTDDDDPAVTFTLASGSQALWQLISVGVSAYELRPRAGAALRPGGRYTVEFIAADDNGDTGESRGRATVAIID
nr:hypothetical protein [Ectothiorhodospiraceae bacterium AqS1]